MAKCQLQQGKHSEAKRYAEHAKRIYPQEAQAHFLAGIVKLREKDFEPAYNDFGRYDNLLPGNPSILFYKGYALEGMRRIKSSAERYHQFLQVVNQGDQAKHAYKRLVEWGYYKKR
jgi:tetratricopeptide (TPR) repeat protein